MKSNLKKFNQVVLCITFVILGIFLISFINSFVYADDMSNFDNPVTLTIFNGTKNGNDIVVDEESVFFEKTVERDFSFSLTINNVVGYTLEYYSYNFTDKTVGEKVRIKDYEWGISSNTYCVAIKIPKSYNIYYYKSKDTASTPIETQTYTIEDNVTLKAYSDIPNQYITPYTKFVNWRNLEDDSVFNNFTPNQNNLKDYRLYMETQNQYNFKIKKGNADENKLCTLQEMLDYANDINAGDGYRYVVTLDSQGVNLLNSKNIAQYNRGANIDVYLYKTDVFAIYYLNATGWDVPLNQYHAMIETPVPAAKKDGYEFLGYTCAALSIYSPQKTIVIPVEFFGDVEIEVHSKMIDYTIHYNLGYEGANNVEETSVANYLCKYGELYDPPYRLGYNFYRWEDELGNPINSNSDFRYLKDITLTAKWRPISVNAIFDVGYKTDETYSKYIEYELPIDFPNVEREGYTFKGWQLGDDLYKDGDISTFTTNIVFSAIWEANEYTVKIHSGNDYAILDEIKVTYDSRVDLNAQKYVKKLLVGFYDDKNGEGNLIATYSGIIEKWHYARDLEIYTYYLLNIGEWVTNCVNVANLPEGYALYINDTLITENHEFRKIGKYKVVLKLNNEIIEDQNCDFTIECRLGTNENIVTSKPIYFNNINATKIIVDGKIIDQNNTRIDKNGEHIVTVYGVGGFERTYVITYKNTNIKTGLFNILGGFILFAIALILTIMGRRRLMDYDNSTINRK